MKTYNLPYGNSLRLDADGVYELLDCDGLSICIGDKKALLKLQDQVVRALLENVGNR